MSDGRWGGRASDKAGVRDGGPGSGPQEEVDESERAYREGVKKRKEEEDKHTYHRLSTREAAEKEAENYRKHYSNVKVVEYAPTVKSLSRPSSNKSKFGLRVER